jgi:hypothetical protein
VTAVLRARRRASQVQPDLRPEYRPGLIAWISRLYLIAMLRRGEVAASDGACLGVRSGCGRRLVVSWLDAAGGVLCTGADAPGVGATAAAFAIAAIQHRKAVLIVDLTAGGPPPGGPAGDHFLPEAMAAAIERACSEAGAPFRIAGSAPASSWRSRIDLPAVLADRSVVLLSPGAGSGTGSRAEAGPGVVARLTAELPELVSDGVAPDCLVWISGCEAVIAAQLTALIQAARQAGIASVVSTADTAAAASLAAQLSVAVVRGPAQGSVLQAILGGGDRGEAGTGGPKALTIAWRGPAPHVAAGTAAR